MELGSVMLIVAVVVVVLGLPLLFRGGKRESSISIQLLKL